MTLLPTEKFVTVDFGKLEILVLGNTCRRGHLMDEKNTRWQKVDSYRDGRKRVCRQCVAFRCRVYRERRKMARS